MYPYMFKHIWCKLIFFFKYQQEVPNDWIVVDADKDVLSLTCPADLQGVKEEDIVVWVDPLDGTSEYTQGKISFTNSDSLKPNDYYYSVIHLLLHKQECKDYFDLFMDNFRCPHVEEESLGKMENAFNASIY